MSVTSVGVSSLSSTAGAQRIRSGTPHVVVTAGSVDVVASTQAQWVDVPISLSARATGRVVVHWRVVPGTAKLGRDVSAGSGTFTFSRSTIELFARVKVLADRVAPTTACWYQGVACRTFSLALSVSSGNAKAAPAPSTDSILWVPGSGIGVGSGDALVVVDAFVGQLSVQVPVSLTAPSSTQVTVAYSTASDTAVSKLDFQPTSGTLTFAAHTISRDVTINLRAAPFDQPFEVFDLVLSNAKGATLLRSTGIGIIATPSEGVADPLSSSYSSATLTQDVSKSGVGDTYDVTDTDGATQVTGNNPIVQSNDRIVFWPAVEAPSADQESCATWAAQSPTQENGSLIQEGLALRVATSDGVTRAITVTKNVYARIYTTLNIHVWNTSQQEPFDLVGSFDVGPYLAANGNPGLPWDVCARAVGSSVQVEMWLPGTPIPAWGDTSEGGTAQLPTGWDYAGSAGWYAGHLATGSTLNYANQYEGAPTSAPVE